MGTSMKTYRQIPNLVKIRQYIGHCTQRPMFVLLLLTMLNFQKNAFLELNGRAAAKT
jgi:hypothetical protein